ncbi:RlpA-like double-psi beta-barrel-protein domain-containing protein-containing protein [Podospora appendiculata]|uniref:RlpA-like double-psi beta-barrel-protein domain-containing protein-containing protein n=1 Tax=Podospora appendiculata TaxID=314037 RepID=A0AAE0WYR8_9PEZI|nr:RlpA-like double-psi beta-barrel-protein domain-containing protein-containing protein [Podospora appendiculata]
MADDKVLPQLPERVRHLPEWETPVHPPKRSLFARLTDQVAVKRTALFTRNTLTPARSDESSIIQQDKETLDGGPILPTHTPTLDNNFSNPPPTSPTRRTLRDRFDALLPPNRTYWHLTRRSLLLFVALPLLLLFILALGLGLGLGLRNSHNSGTGYLPLPGDKAVHSGDLTYYDIALGACGWTNDDDEYVCAVAHSVYDAAATGSSKGNPNLNPLCGKKIRVMRDYSEAGLGNVTVDVTVVDRCVGCAPEDLDLSPAVFNRLAPETKGRVVGQWAWLD